MRSTTLDPHQLLRVGRLLEQRGEELSAVIAYREVILAGEALTSAEARRRLEDLMLRAMPARPC